MPYHNSSLPKTADPAGRYIDSVKRLPAAPTVAMELLVVFKDINHDVDRIVELISLDPSLTVEVLKRCNSAYFRGREEVRDMFSAVRAHGATRARACHAHFGKMEASMRKIKATQ